MLAGHHIAISWWSPVAYLWQDAAAVLIFAAIELCLSRSPRMAWVVYGAAAMYAAINVPVARALSTPLTWPMWRAARGPLADSMWYYVTWQNAMLVASVLAVAALAPALFRHARPKPLLAAFVLCAALGPVAAAHIDTLGFERNAWAALVATFPPRMPLRDSSPGEWRVTGFDRTVHADLSRLQGIAAGRNIVLVSLESTAAQYLGLYGAVPDPMPNLSRLARTAVVFDNAYAVYPESIKGLFSILCSVYPAFDSPAEMYAGVPCRSMAQVLSDAGYRTALFHSGRFLYLGMEAVIRGRGFATMEDAGDIGGNRHSSFGVDEPATVAHILAWLDALPPGQRFFVTHLPIAGHHPYESPAGGPFPDDNEFGRYRNALHYGDTSLGTLIEGLRARGLDQNTVWIILGDHGEAFGQHEGNYGHTFHLHEENVHVPFLIAMPGLAPRQIRSRKVVSLIDTAPTVLALTGLPVPGNYQGRSMFDPTPRMALFFADYSLSMLGLRDGARKFIYELGSGRARLFDLERDPRENINLADRYAEAARWYAQDLRRWGAAQKRLLMAATGPMK
jgi:arylsulfatase A-like enzyme